MKGNKEMLENKALLITDEQYSYGGMIISKLGKDYYVTTSSQIHGPYITINPIQGIDGVFVYEDNKKRVILGDIANYTFDTKNYEQFKSFFIQLGEYIIQHYGELRQPPCILNNLVDSTAITITEHSYEDSGLVTVSLHINVLAGYIKTGLWDNIQCKWLLLPKFRVKIRYINDIKLGQRILEVSKEGSQSKESKQSRGDKEALIQRNKNRRVLLYDIDEYLSTSKFIPLTANEYSSIQVLDKQSKRYRVSTSEGYEYIIYSDSLADTPLTSPLKQPNWYSLGGNIQIAVEEREGFGLAKLHIYALEEQQEITYTLKVGEPCIVNRIIHDKLEQRREKLISDKTPIKQETYLFCSNPSKLSIDTGLWVTGLDGRKKMRTSSTGFTISTDFTTLSSYLNSDKALNDIGCTIFEYEDNRYIGTKQVE